MPYFQNNYLKFLFIHIPKTGGTSLENFLSQKFNIPLNSDSLYSTPENGYKNVSLQHQTYHTLFKKKQKFGIDFTSKNLKIISIVRNPYERTVSDLFYFKLITISTSQEEVFEILQKYIVSKTYDNHNIPQHLFLLNNRKKIKKNIVIFKTETLTDDLIKYGFVDFNIHKNVNKLDNINYYDFLNSDSMKLINNFYKKDFEFFDYPIITK
jgi:hypothetical protein